MNNVNIIEVRFNMYDGQKSDIPSLVLEHPLEESFSYGDCFGGNGVEIWLDVNQNLNEWKEENDEEVDEEHLELFNELSEMLEANF